MDSQSNLLQTYNACLDNARELLNEAELLVKYKNFARAYVVAFTALEEVSKSQIVADYFTGLIDKKRLESLFKDHSSKIKRVEWVIDVIDKYRHEHGFEYQGTRPTFEARNAALYVDINRDNAPLLPKDSVTEETVRNLMNLVEVGLNEIWEQSDVKGEQIGTKGFMK